MKKLSVLLIISALSTGCASRAYLQEGNPLKPAFNLYNRNYVVAAPTYVGNVICGTPFLLISGGVDTLIPGKKSETYFRVINGIWLVPASICGFITGSLFVPISFACKEDPWDFDFQTVRSKNWNCRGESNLTLRSSGTGEKPPAP